MEQKETRSDLLLEVIEEFINTGKTPNPVVFRADHAERIKEIDDLEARQLLQYGDGGYKVPLIEFQKSKLWPRERRIANKILKKLKGLYRDDPLKTEFPMSLAAPDEEPGVDALDVRRAAYYLHEAGFLKCSPRLDAAGKCEAIAPSERVLHHDDIDAKIADNEKAKRSYQQLRSGESFPAHKAAAPAAPKVGKSMPSMKELWDQIEKDCGDSKVKFGRSINFVKDKYAREAIFRDIAHAQGCLKSGFYKPAAILAGGVVEELLRRYLIHKGFPPKPREATFHLYIDACQEHGLIKRALVRVTGSVQDFRNLVHLKEETSKRHAISRSTAAGMIHAIFTLSHDFQ